ncbi:MAG: saccharopine dehydrogenase NADP-binding domain-containing protein, partial [Halobacteria archaeon]|nr:saccharopine dehydrogenase NADP-binding domain-containing protein [Halobacteria archaeon]
MAQRASDLGHSPVLAGRNPEKLRDQEDGLEGSFETRDFELDNPEDVAEELDESGVDAVLNCAGPFAKTYEPLVEACVDTGTHYLDITGEVEVFRGIEAYDKRAEKEGVTLIPGVGFDVVPTDCLSLHLKNRLQSADSLTVAVKALSSISHGTALTVVENIGEGGLVRRSGALEKVPTAWKSREFDFGARDEDREVGITVPLGDVVTAYHSTRIPNIETYVTVPPKARYVVESTRYIGGVLGSPPVKKLL